MSDFHYNVVKYGEQAVLLFTDTNSFCFGLRPDNVYVDMFAVRHRVDFSGCPRDAVSPLNNYNHASTNLLEHFRKSTWIILRSTTGVEHDTANDVGSLHDTTNDVGSLHDTANDVGSLHDTANDVGSLHDTANDVGSLHDTAKDMDYLHTTTKYNRLQRQNWNSLALEKQKADALAPNVFEE
ncbi:hypothetical protein CHS0354_035652 [Potamilus streckersoni]|uniref:Uncharacterized protein n=1 Tax=Potamilus streckersoni TaxID=2493646 RepID=A0AAE0SAY8_9BIVA|nr:hypothetical protein CHS0354_035652 [Potamilus streckersoni]